MGELDCLVLADVGLIRYGHLNIHFFVLLYSAMCATDQIQQIYSKQCPCFSAVKKEVMEKGDS